MLHLKYIVLLLLSTCFNCCQSQDQKLLLNTKIVDLRPADTTSINYEKWLKKNAYLDSLEIGKITYLSDGLRVNGMLLKPKKAGKYPCIIFNRGGNRDFGELDYGTAFWLSAIARKGYVIIGSQYRGNAGSEGKEEFGGKDINDVLVLCDVLKEIEGADVKRIGMYGWSRGGMMTYIAITKTNKIKTAVVGGAISDAFEGIKDRPGMEDGVYSELIPDYYANREEELTKRSAIKWVDKFSKNVPILLLHGNSDWRVKSTQSLNLALEFEKYRIPYRLKIFEGGDHGISEFRDEVDKDVLNWFDRYLKNEEKLPDMTFHGN